MMIAYCFQMREKKPFELLPGNKGLQNKLLSGPRAPSFKGRIPGTELGAPG